MSYHVGEAWQLEAKFRTIKSLILNFGRMDLSDEELILELARRKAMLDKKRKHDEIMTERRNQILEELSQINSELEPMSSSSSSSSSKSSSSSSTSAQLPPPDLPPPLPIVDAVDARAEPKPKNSMFTYWAVKDNSVVDIEELDARRKADAKINSESRQSSLHRERKIAVGSQNKPKVTAALRVCSQSSWLIIKKKLKGDDIILVTYNVAEKRIYCSACVCYVRDDNVEDHIVTGKHEKASKLTVESNLHQTNLENAIKISTTLSNCVPGRTHLFRCELVRTLLTAAMPISKADDWRSFLEKWVRVESTDSTNLLREYLPIIKVTRINVIF